MMDATYNKTKRSKLRIAYWFLLSFNEWKLMLRTDKLQTSLTYIYIYIYIYIYKYLIIYKYI